MFVKFFLDLTLNDCRLITVEMRYACKNVKRQWSLILCIFIDLIS